MSSEKVYKRLFDLRASIDKMIVDGVRDPSRVAEVLQGIVDDPPSATKVYLSNLFGGRRIKIDATDGTETLAKAGDVFTGYLDRDFVNWGLDISSEATPETEVAVYEQVVDGTFAEVFGSLGELDRLCLTQSQIKKFVAMFYDKLRTEGYATFFVFKKDGEFFVAFVHFYDDGRLNVGVHEFSLGHVWLAKCRDRFVAPQL